MLASFPKTWWFFFVIFILHQVVEKIVKFRIELLDNYLDPLLTFPILLGAYLAQKRYFLKLGNRHQLTTFEIVTITIVYSFIFEWGFPKYFEGFYFDPWDFLAYGIGALIFYLIQWLDFSKKEFHGLKVHVD